MRMRWKKSRKARRPAAFLQQPLVDYDAFGTLRVRVVTAVACYPSVRIVLMKRCVKAFEWPKHLRAKNKNILH